MRLNLGPYGNSNRLGDGWNFPESWSWQPSLTAHDPNPPLPLETAAGGDGIITLQTVNGVATVGNLTVSAPLIMGTLSATGSSGVGNLVVSAPVGLTATSDGISNVTNVSIATIAGVIPGQVSGVAFLANVTVETPITEVEIAKNRALIYGAGGTR